MLKLYEELFLISINDATGQVAGVAASYLPYGLAGALLVELALLGKVQADGKRLAVLDPTPTGDELLDEALATVAASAKPRKLAHWINALGSGKLHKRVARGLAARNVLRIEEKRVLWVIPYEAYPQQDASAKYWVKARLRGMVLGGEPPEPRAVALLSLLRGCRLLGLVFTKDERKAARQKIETLAGADLFGQAVAETLDEVDGALTATMVAVNAAAYS
jgi:hypothetical protein